MIVWKVYGGYFSPDESQHRIAEVNRVWRESGLLVAYEPEDFPLPDREGEVAGVSWHDVHMRGLPEGGGGAPTPDVIEPLFEFVSVYLWPYAKLAAAAAGAGFAAKAGADGWDLCKKGLKAGLRAVFGTSKGVRVYVVKGPDPVYDLQYEIEPKDVDTLDDAVDAIAEHAQGFEVDDTQPFPMWTWSGDAARLKRLHFDARRGWVPEDDPDEPEARGG